MSLSGRFHKQWVSWRGGPRLSGTRFRPFAAAARARQVARLGRRTAAWRGYMRRSGYFGRFGGARRGRRANGAVEYKFHDIDIDDATIAQNGNIAEDSVNAIPQGVTENTRVGRKCTIRMINWRFTITIGPKTSASATSDVVRVILYLDKQCNGAAATVTGILETDNFQSFNNLANKSRFRILMDRKYDIMVLGGGGDGTTEDWSENKISDALYKKCNIPIEFDSTTGAITEVRSNNIGVLLLSEGGNAGFESKMRLRFSDS